MLNHSSLAIPEKQLFVSKSDLIFDSKREQIIRDLLTVKLLKGSLGMAELNKEVMDVASCDFTLLKPILETVGHKPKGSDKYELKSFAQEIDESLEFTPELLKTNTTRIRQLENMVTKAKKSDFLKTGTEPRKAKETATNDQIRQAFITVLKTVIDALTENHVLH